MRASRCELFPQLVHLRDHHVLHLGACSATTERDADYLMRNNYEFTKQLCQWALSAKSRFVYASSAATYGDGAHGMDDQMPDIHALRPLNMYGYSKHLFDLHAQREGWLKRIVGVKYFNVYGPNEDHKGDMRSLVNKAFGFWHAIEEADVQLFERLERGRRMRSDTHRLAWPSL